MNSKRRVAVIFGGQSSEHEVSRISATSIIKNINTDKYDIVLIGITKTGKWFYYNGPVDKIASGEWESLDCEPIVNILELPAINVVFPVLHGCNGEDGTIQGLFELQKIPYVGCRVLASALAMDKVYSKLIFDRIGLVQGYYEYFTRKEIEEDIYSIINKVEKNFIYPCFVKPSNAGSSVGVSKAHSKDELVKALLLASKHDKKVLVEEFINCREIECSVLGNDNPIVSSVVGEILPSNEFYDYDAKYLSNDSKAIIPADLPKQTLNEIKDYALKAFKALGCTGLARVDFFIHKETGKVYINELNTMPGFTTISLYPKLWEASGIPYAELVDRLIDLALENYKDNTIEFEII